MSRRNGWIFSLVAAAVITVPNAPPAGKPLEHHSLAGQAKPDTPDTASIVKRKLDFYGFTYQTVGGTAFDLRDYARNKVLVIVEYLAGWCPNSNRNGHIIQRLWARYRGRGLGVVGVAEYSSAGEIRTHIGRIGIDYPVVVETRKRDQRKDSAHYRYRRAAGDTRKWGTPFYIIIDARDIEPSTNGPLARDVYTVSGEMVEAEADQFIRVRIEERKATQVSATGAVVRAAGIWDSPSPSCGSVTTVRF
jgi:hypothetical protein